MKWQTNTPPQTASCLQHSIWRTCQMNTDCILFWHRAAARNTRTRTHTTTTQRALAWCPNGNASTAQCGTRCEPNNSCALQFFARVHISGPSGGKAGPPRSLESFRLFAKSVSADRKRLPQHERKSIVSGLVWKICPLRKKNPGNLVLCCGKPVELVHLALWYSHIVIPT